MLIMGFPPNSITLQFVQGKLPGIGANALFINEIAPAIWRSAVKYGVNPVGAVAQAFKETGGGAFTGNVKAAFCNPAGLKLRYPNMFPGITDGDNPLAHTMFPTWEVGCEAFIQHLRAYVGPLEGHMIIDPRYVFVAGRYQVTTFEELSGKWAPSLTYGQEVVSIANRLV